MTQATINGNTYSDDGTSTRDMLNGGHREWFLPMVGDVAIVAGEVAADAAQAAIDAASAAAFAAAGVVALNGTSATSITVGAGAKVFTTQAGKSFVNGSYVSVSRESSPTTSMHGVVTSYSGTALTVEVSIFNGAGTYNDWIIALSGAAGAAGPSGDGQITRLAKSGTYAITAADKAKLIDCTGTFTLSFASCATLGAAWATYIRNAGSGDIPLDPNGSETIDGLSSYVMYPGEVRLIQCDGSALRSVVIHGFSKTFVASGTFIKPPGYSLFQALLWGGGNSGQKNSGDSYGGGGGGSFLFTIPASALSASETVTIGAGGAAKTTTGNGLIGGSTSFGSVASVLSDPSLHYYGGSVVSGRAEAVPVWDGGSGSTGAGPSSGSVYGAGAGGSITSSVVRSPGASIYGGSGGAASVSGNGDNGVAPGGGGGATQTGAQSGAGARGECRIWGVV